MKDELMTRMAAVTAADSDPETAAAKQKAREVELKVDAAVDLGEALAIVQFESLVAKRAALVAEVVAVAVGCTGPTSPNHHCPHERQRPERPRR